MDRLEGLLDLELPREGRLEDLLGGLLGQILWLKCLVERFDQEFRSLLALEIAFRVLVALRFHPLLRMRHRASNRVLPVQPVLVLVLQMFSCRPWSSLTKPYLAA